jgi:hypothetical protein
LSLGDVPTLNDPTSVHGRLVLFGMQGRKMVGGGIVSSAAVLVMLSVLPEGISCIVSSLLKLVNSFGIGDVLVRRRCRKYATESMIVDTTDTQVHNIVLLSVLFVSFTSVFSEIRLAIDGGLDRLGESDGTNDG